MLRVLTLLMISASLMFVCASLGHAKENNKYASLVMDADTGSIISQRYADKSLHPASLTKMMTLMMVFEALDRGDIKKSSRVYVSKYAASMVPSKLYLKPGEYIKVEDAIYSLVTKSANDVSVALAEKIGGSEAKFAQLMTTRARSIGMKNTRFKNANGLHHRDQVTTARDMATLARYMLQRYPHYYRYFSTRNFNYNGKSYRNHNRLMDSYKGMDGFKTGYINASGFNLVASARQNNRRLIGVVFGGRSSSSRNAHMAEILDVGFKKVGNMRTARIVAPPIPKQKPGIQLVSTQQVSQELDIKPMGAPPITTAIKNDTSYASVSALSTRGNYNSKQSETSLTRALNNQQFGLIEQSRVNTNPPQQEQKKTNISANNLERPAVQPTIPNEWDSEKQKISGLPHPKDTVGKWSVQIGAFESRVKTDNVLRQAVQTLPTNLSILVSPVSVPMHTSNGMIFRARLAGLSQQQAFEACTYFKDCMTVAPRKVSLSSK